MANYCKFIKHNQFFKKTKICHFYLRFLRWKCFKHGNQYEKGLYNLYCKIPVMQITKVIGVQSREGVPDTVCRAEL